jgi:hypothetical protein
MLPPPKIELLVMVDVTGWYSATRAAVKHVHSNRFTVAVSPRLAFPLDRESHEIVSGRFQDTGPRVSRKTLVSDITCSPG